MASHLLVDCLGSFTEQPGRITRERVWKAWNWATITSTTFFLFKASQPSPESKGEEVTSLLDGSDCKSAVGTGNGGELCPFLLLAASNSDPELCLDHRTYTLCCCP